MSGRDTRDVPRRALRALARLLDYPGPNLREHLPALADAVTTDAALTPARRAELGAFVRWLAAQDALDAEAGYVELFDRGRATSLHLFEHVHGDSRERGPALLDLARTYRDAGLVLRADELPDYLPVVLEYASTLSAAESRAFLAEAVHLLKRIYSALRTRGSPYASLVAATIDLAGATAEIVAIADEEALDVAWEEPPVFAGCTAHGQARPAAPHVAPVLHRSVASVGDNP